MVSSIKQEIVSIGSSLYGSEKDAFGEYGFKRYVDRTYRTLNPVTLHATFGHRPSTSQGTSRRASHSGCVIYNNVGFGRSIEE